MILNFQKIILILSRVRLRIDNEKKVNAMKWYSYLILLLMYIIYLAIGAYVFQMFEKPHEVKIVLIWYFPHLTCSD